MGNYLKNNYPPPTNSTISIFILSFIVKSLQLTLGIICISTSATRKTLDKSRESANFSKFNILAQSGSYAMSQANSVQQNILRLLQ